MAELDSRQHAAVSAGPVDLFIAAGAGSGKTRVLATRFVSAVLGVPPYSAGSPESLLAVTFTEKAAGELVERIRGALRTAGNAASARAVGDAWISTIHGMCSRILRQHALQAGIDPSFVVLDAIEASALEAESVEAVVREALESDEGFVTLMDSYGFTDVVAAAQMVRSKMHALGLPVKDIGTVGGREVLEALQVMAAELRARANDLEGLKVCATVRANAEAVRGLAIAVDGFVARPGDDAAALVGAAEACRVRHDRRIEGHEELVESCKLLIDQVKAAAAQSLVADAERTLIGFAGRLHGEYQRRKREAGALDFEDLQVITAELIDAHPEIAQRYRERFTMLMLDEFQDTNELQLRIIQALADGNLCTVGDENQSIYSFRHADVEVFRRRGADCPLSLPLDINYRTHPELLAVINGLFAGPRLLGPTFMRLQVPDAPRITERWPQREARFDVRFIDQASGDADAKVAEAERVAERVAELIAGGLEPHDIAVLMRALSGGRAQHVESALAAHGIPVYIASGGAFFDQPEIIETRALLAAIANVWDDAALGVVLAGRLTGLSADALIALRSHADAIAAEQGRHRSEVHLWEAGASEDLGLSSLDVAALRRTYAVIDAARRARGTRALADVVLDAVQALDFDLVLFSQGRAGERSWANVMRLVRLAAEYESATTGDLGAFLEYLQLREAHATSEQEATIDGEANAVRVMSIHAAKGLEFPAVIVCGLASPGDAGPVYFGRVDGRPMLGMTLKTEAATLQTMGSIRVRDAAQAAAEAEAIRLLYVACTRAEEGLTLIARTDPERDAGKSLGDLVRAALGMGDAGELREGPVSIGEGQAVVRVLERGSVPEVSRPLPSDDYEEAPSPWVEPPSEEKHSAACAIPERLSYTSLTTYGRCPLRFFLTSVAKLPAPPATRTGDALAFGDAVHLVLSRCESGSVDPAPFLAPAARAAGLSADSLPRLENAVRSFLASPLAEDVFASDQVQHEAPISVALQRAVLVGAIDCIGWRGEEALIVDYKTGSAELGEDEARERYRLQSECYALAALSAGAKSVQVVFTELERGREIRYAYEANSEGELRSHLEALSGSLGTDGYPPRETYEQELCETCPGLGGVCPMERP
jgi:ATP-dependent exoDNAse (exonuclease V) beta subunit